MTSRRTVALLLLLAAPTACSSDHEVAEPPLPSSAPASSPSVPGHSLKDYQHFSLNGR